MLAITENLRGSRGAHETAGKWRKFKGRSPRGAHQSRQTSKNYFDEGRTTTVGKIVTVRASKNRKIQ
jgi:hypothetical protein